MFGYTIVRTKELKRIEQIFKWASDERTRADKLLSKIMMTSDSVEVSKTAQEISEILRGERRISLEF